MPLTDEDRAGLTDAEIAAIEAPEDASELAPGIEPALEMADDPDDDEPDGEEVAAEAAPEPERQPFVPTYDAPAVEDFDGQMEALAERYTDGDLNLNEYTKQTMALSRAQAKAEMSAEMNAQVAEKVWDNAVTEFFDGNPVYADAILKGALDSQVRALAALPENANWSANRFLSEAHKAVSSRFKMGNEKPNDSKLAGDAKPKPRKPDLRAVPVTLAGVPAAGQDIQGADEFSALDKLGGVALERALAGLSETQRDRYYQSA